MSQSAAQNSGTDDEDASSSGHARTAGRRGITRSRNKACFARFGVHRRRARLRDPGYRRSSIVITSDPVGATCQVRQGAAYVGTVTKTPGTIYVGKSRHDIAIDCTRPGYFPGAAVLEPHFQDMTIGNIIYGGSIGVLVDTSTGAINEYPHWVSIIMKRQGPRGEAVARAERRPEVDDIWMR